MVLTLNFSKACIIQSWSKHQKNPEMFWKKMFILVLHYLFFIPFHFLMEKENKFGNDAKWGRKSLFFLFFLQLQQIEKFFQGEK